MSEDEFDNFEFTEEIEMEINRALHKIVDESDYQKWEATGTINKENEKYESFECENTFIGLNKRYAITKLTNHKQNSVFREMCRILATRSEIIKNLEMLRDSEDMEYCLDALQCLFRVVQHTNGSMESTKSMESMEHQNKKKRIEMVELLDTDGILIRFLVEYAISNAFLNPNHKIIDLLCQYCCCHFTTININHIQTMHSVCNISASHISRILSTLMQSSLELKLLHFSVALEHNPKLVEDWLLSYPVDFFITLKAQSTTTVFKQELQTILSLFGTVFVSKLVDNSIPFFSWFLSINYAILLPELNTIQQIALQLGGCSYMQSLFINDDSIFEFIDVFSDYPISKDPIGFMAME